jgi:hypothetical protein
MAGKLSKRIKGCMKARHFLITLFLISVIACTNDTENNGENMDTANALHDTLPAENSALTVPIDSNAAGVIHVDSLKSINR